MAYGMGLRRGLGGCFPHILDAPTRELSMGGKGYREPVQETYGRRDELYSVFVRFVYV